jgi:hypothetical protein
MLLMHGATVKILPNKLTYKLHTSKKYVLPENDKELKPKKV